MSYRDLCTVCTTPQTPPSIPHFLCRIPRDLPGPAATHVRTQWIVCSARSEGGLPRRSPELDLSRHLPEPMGSVRLSLRRPSTRTIYKSWAMPFPRGDETRGGRGRFNSLFLPHVPERGLCASTTGRPRHTPGRDTKEQFGGKLPRLRSTHKHCNNVLSAYYTTDREKPCG